MNNSMCKSCKIKNICIVYNNYHNFLEISNCDYYSGSMENKVAEQHIPPVIYPINKEPPSYPSPSGWDWSKMYCENIPTNVFTSDSSLQPRKRDMTVDLKNLYCHPNEVSSKAESTTASEFTCEYCGDTLWTSSIEECAKCGKKICFNCACTNVDDSKTYCPDCMDL